MNPLRLGGARLCVSAITRNLQSPPKSQLEELYPKSFKIAKMRSQSRKSFLCDLAISSFNHYAKDDFGFHGIAWDFMEFHGPAGNRLWRYEENESFMFHKVLPLETYPPKNATF